MSIVPKWPLNLITHALGCKYSPQNIYNAKNFNPHKKPIPLLCMPPPLHPEGAVSLVASKEYYNCHWVLFKDRYKITTLMEYPFHY